MLNDLQVEDLVVVYRQQLTRFEEAAEAVATRAQRELRARAVRTLVSFRAKHPDDVANKLRDRSKKDPARYDFEKLRRTFDRIVTDLAGCRIVVYRPRDVETVRDAIEKTFTLADVPNAKESHDKTTGYRAHHFLVVPPANERSSIDGTVVEVQVCSLADHLFNELQHDSGYKGEVSSEEVECVKDLLHLVRVTDTTSARLFDARAKSASERDEPLEDAEALRFVAEQVASRPLTGDFARLFKFLNSTIPKLTPARVKSLDLNAQLEFGKNKLTTDPDLVDDDVACIAIGLSRKYGQELKASASSWRGPETPLKRAILAFAEGGEE